MKTIVFVRSTNIYDDSRATKEILALAESGFQVYVLGWNRNGEAEEKCKSVFGKYKNIKCMFFSVKIDRGIGMKNIHILVAWLHWIKKKIKQIKKIKKVYAVHICNLDCAIGVVSYCHRKKIKIVYDIYDYYIDSHYIPSKLLGVVESLEINAINISELTIICTEERREQISKATPKKVIVVHNSPEVPEIEIKNEIYDYAYCGALGERRLIKEILDEYKNHCDKIMIMAGYDKYSENANAIAKKYENFTFLGPIPYSRVLEIEAKSKVIAAIYEPTIRNHRLCAPNKFYEALALAKPVIVCRGTGIDKIVSDNQIGIVIDYSANEFYEALDYLCNEQDVREAMGLRARKLYNEKYNWSIMKHILLDAYNEIM